MAVLDNPQIRGSRTEIDALLSLDSASGSRTLGLQAEAVSELVNVAGRDLLREARDIANDYATGTGDSALKLAGLKAFQKLNMQPPGLDRIDDLLTKIPNDPNASPQDIVTITKAGSALVRQISEQVEFAVMCFEKLRTPEGATAAQRLSDLLAARLSGVVEHAEQGAVTNYALDVGAAAARPDAPTPDNAFIKHTLERSAKTGPDLVRNTNQQVAELKAADSTFQLANAQVGALLTARFPGEHKAADVKAAALSTISDGLVSISEDLASTLASTVKRAAEERLLPKAQRTVPVKLALLSVDACSELCGILREAKSGAEAGTIVPRLVSALSEISSQLEKNGNPTLAVKIKKDLSDGLSRGLTDYRTGLVGIAEDKAENSRTITKATGFFGFIADKTPDWLGGKGLRAFVKSSQDNSAHRLVETELGKVLDAGRSEHQKANDAVKKDAASAANTAGLRETQLDALLSFSFKNGSKGREAQSNVLQGISGDLSDKLRSAGADTGNAMQRACNGELSALGLKVLTESAKRLSELEKLAAAAAGDPSSQLRTLKTVFRAIDGINARYSEAGLFEEAKKLSGYKAELLEGKLGTFQQSMADIIADRNKIYNANGESSPLTGWERFTRRFTTTGRAELAARNEAAEALRAVTELDKISGVAATPGRAPDADFAKRDKEAGTLLAQINAVASRSEVGSGSLRAIQISEISGSLSDLYSLLRTTRGEFNDSFSPDSSGLTMERRASLISGSVTMSSLSKNTVSVLRALENGNGTLPVGMLPNAKGAFAELVSVLRESAYSLEKSAGTGDTKGADLHKSINDILGNRRDTFVRDATQFVLTAGTYEEDTAEYQQGVKAVEILEELENLRRMQAA